MSLLYFSVKACILGKKSRFYWLFGGAMQAA
ncbi:hypothetical protein C824_000457 [Schaedlerella arabinosiphila]|nr:hypothetical protein C824_000457 [Schaedlerella arabinosiphila]